MTEAKIRMLSVCPAINAIEVKIQPDDAEWDAGDIRYNVLRWTSSPDPMFGGYGPSFTNPRTGEIIGADIMLEWTYITNRIVSNDLFVEPTNYNDNHQCIAGKCQMIENAFGLNYIKSLNLSILILRFKLELIELLKSKKYFAESKFIDLVSKNFNALK